MKMKKNKRTEEAPVLLVDFNQPDMNEKRLSTTEFPTLNDQNTAVFESVQEYKKEKRGSATSSVNKDTIVVPDVSGRVMDEQFDTQEIETDITLSKASSSPAMEKTQVLEMEGSEEETLLAERGTQLMLDGFAEEAPETEAVDESRLQRVRKEQIEDFSQKREQLIQSREVAETVNDGERGDVVYPETPLDAGEPEEPAIHDRPELIRQQLQTAQKRAGLSLFFTVVSESVLLILSLLSTVSPALSMTPTTFLGVNLFLLAVAIVANGGALFDGLKRLLSRSVNAATGVAISAVLTLIHTGLQFLNFTGIADGSTQLLTVISGFGILLLCIAKRLESDRQNRQISFLLDNGSEKFVLKNIEDPDLAEEIGRPAVALGDPLVAYTRKTQLVDGFVDLSNDNNFGSRSMGWYLPIAFVASFAVALVYFILNGLSSWFTVITLFCSLFAVSTPMLFPLMGQVAMAVTATNALKEQTVIAGYHSVDEHGAIHALALDAADIFPEQSVLLHGIKTFSGTRIDDAILDAASVSVRAGGPLSTVFRRMIQNKVDMLREVDTLVYEQDMGLSGWVSGRRVLIGNRKLLNNHGIDIPSKDYEDRYAKNGRQLVYLSIAGELSAMFVVSYIADPAVKDVLTRLTKQRVTLMIRTCDQNITERLVASVFDLNGFYVEVMNAPAGRSYEALTDGVTASEEVGVISKGDCVNVFRAVSSCCRLYKLINLFTVLQSIVAVAGIGLIGYTVLFGGVLLSPVYILGLLMVSTVIFSLVSALSSHK